MYTHRSTYLHTMAQAMTDAMALSATDAVCGIVPMFHAMGWGLPFSATMLGAKQVMPHRFMDAEGAARPDVRGAGHDLGGRADDLAGRARRDRGRAGALGPVDSSRASPAAARRRRSR